jgi:hypothetical protein
MSNGPSEVPWLEHLERDLPTTAADVEALRRLRATLPAGLHDAARTYPFDPVELLARRPTSEGWEPLTL